MRDTDIVTKHPEQAKDLVKRSVVHSDGESIHIDAEQLGEFYQTKDLDPETEIRKTFGDDAAKSYLDAVNDGGLVELETKDYVVESAKSKEFHEETQDKISVGEDGASNLEIQEFFQDRDNKENTKSEAIRKLEAGEEIELSEIDSNENELQRTEIADSISAQLQAAGQTGALVDGNASVLAAGYASIAENAGLQPKELFERFSVTVNKDGDRQGQVFNQSKDNFLEDFERTEDGFNVSFDFEEQRLKLDNDNVSADAVIQTIEASSFGEIESSLDEQGFERFLALENIENLDLS